MLQVTVHGALLHWVVFVNTAFLLPSFFYFASSQMMQRIV